MDKLDKESVIGISALLVHAANIDEIYSKHEKDLIKNFIKSYLKNEDTDEILKEAEKLENSSNQLISFTTIIKKNSITKPVDINKLPPVTDIGIFGEKRFYRPMGGKILKMLL